MCVRFTATLDHTCQIFHSFFISKEDILVGAEKDWRLYYVNVLSLGWHLYTCEIIGQ